MSEEEKIEGPLATDDGQQPGEIISPEGTTVPENEEQPSNDLNESNESNKNMEVHHHAHAPHGKKNWRSYFWEFLMLFLAVFCGFLAEYQLEHYIEKQRAKDFALSLHRDLVADTTIFNNTILRLTICTKKIDTLIGLLATDGQITEQTAAVYNLSVFAFIYPSSTPNESTLQQLLNSGSLRYIKDNLLVDSIKQYNNSVQLFRDLATSSAELNIEFRKFQMQVIDINPVIGFMQAGRLFSGTAIDISDLDYFNKSQLLTSDPLRLKEYANWCGLKKFYFVNSVTRYERLKTQATGLLKLLGKRYNIK